MDRERKQGMVISVMAKDRPGIVADVTEGISSLGGNLADLRESVLCGYFTMILIAGFPEPASVEQVEKVLAEKTGSNVSVALYEGALTEPENIKHAYVLSAVGRDRSGLVAQVSRFCSDRGVNVLDLTSHVEADQYMMMLQIDLSNIEFLNVFKEELSCFGEQAGLRLVLQHNDIFKATNEI